MTNTTLLSDLRAAQDHLQAAHDNLCQALAFAKQTSRHPVLLVALHDSAIQANSLQNQLDPIIATLDRPGGPVTP